MRRWDIVEVETSSVTRPLSSKSRFVGAISSAVKAAIVLGVITGSSAAVLSAAKPSDVASCSTRLVIHAPAEPAKTKRPGPALTDSDTQLGMSSNKLARRLEAFFQPALDEESFEDDYTFA